MKNNSIWGGYFSKDSRILKGSVLVAIAAIFSIGGFFVSHANAQAYTPTSVFVDSVQQIPNASSSAAVADNNFDHGWKWVFYVTVPNTYPHDETFLQMKFADWMNGSNIIPAGDNMRFYSEQSTNAMDEANAIPITSSTTWSDIMDLNPNIDLNSTNAGRQIEIFVEAKIPTTAISGSYSTSYDINTTATSSISFDGLTQTYNSHPLPVTVTTDPIGLANTVTYTGIDVTYPSSTTPPTHVGTYAVNAVITDPGYTGTSAAQLEIRTAPVTVTVYPETKVYDNSTSTDPALTSTTTPPLFDGDSFTGTLARSPGEDVGSYLIATGTLALDGDYELTVVPNYFTITQASAQITLGNLEQTYDKIGKSVSTSTLPVGLSVGLTYDGLPTLPVNAGTHIVVATITDPNYTGSTTENLIIDPASLIVTATTSTKTYDGTPSSTGTPTITSGKLFGTDTAIWTQTFDSKDVGDRILTPSDTINDDNGGNNYNITFATSTGSITPATATVSATGHDKVYDGTTAASTTLKVDGAVGTDSLTATDTATFVSKDVADGIEVDVTGITISGPGVTSDDYTYNATASTTANITPASLSITANDESKTYGDTFIFTGKEFTPSGLLDGDSISSTTITSPGAASTSPVGTYPIDISDATGTGLGNYSIHYSDGTLTVSKNNLSATITAQGKTYDGNNTEPDANLTCNPVGMVNGDVISCTATNGTFNDKNVETGKVVTADVSFSGANVGNYSTSSSATTTASITTRPLTVTATTTTKVYDGNTSSDGTPTITSGSIATGDTAPAWTQTYNDKDFGTDKILTPAGIVSDNNGGANYDVTYATTTGSITSATATVSATGQNKVYDGTAVATVDLNVTGAVGSDVLTATPSKAIFVGSNGKNIGTHPISVTGIVVTGPGVTSNDYTYNTSTSTSATITAKALTATITAPDKTYDGTASSTITICTPVGVASGDSVQCTATNGTFSDMNVGTDKIVTADVNFTGAVSNYSLATTATTTASITPLNLTGTLIASDKTYDGTNIASTSCSLSGVINGDGVSCVTSSSVFSTRNAGTNQVTADLILSGTDKDNYSVNPTASTTATISKLTITVTAKTDTKVYDGTTTSNKIPTIDPSLVGGDTPGFIQVFDLPDAGPRILTPSGKVNDNNNGDNYNVSFATTTGTITQASQTIRFVTYPSGAIDGNSFVVTATSSSGLPVSFTGGAGGICTVEATGTVDVIGSGQCPVTATQGGDTDYSPAPNVTKTFTVTYHVSATLLTSTDITSNNSPIGTLAGATLSTTGTGSCDGTNSGTSDCYILNVANVQVSPSGGKLPAEDDGFMLTSSSANLTAYFAAKGWPSDYITQINSEIAGTAPFFYFVSDGNGHYSLDDGFQGVGHSLVIDSDYPVGTYTFTGNVNGSPVTVTLTVGHLTIGPHFGPPFIPLTGTPTMITTDTSGIVATGTRSFASGGDILNFRNSQSTLS